jgi:hypothetical protein
VVSAPPPTATDDVTGVAERVVRSPLPDAGVIDSAAATAWEIRRPPPSPLMAATPRGCPAYTQWCAARQRTGVVSAVMAYSYG